MRTPCFGRPQADAGAGKRAATVAIVAALFGLALGSGLLTAPPASAHDSLASTSPADGARLSKAPSRVALRFTGEVIPSSASIAVRGPEGRLPKVAARINGQRVVRSLPSDLPAGDYTVAWRVTSSDGHPINGTQTFALTATPTTATAGTAATPTAAPREIEGGGEETDAPSAAADDWGGPQPPLLIGAGAIVGAGLLLAVPAILRRSRRGDDEI